MKLDIYSQNLLIEEGYVINGGELKAPPRPFTQGDYQFLLNGGDIDELENLSPMGRKMAFHAANQWGRREDYPSFEGFIKRFFFTRELTRVILDNPDLFFHTEIQSSGWVDGEWVEKTQTKYLGGYFNSPWGMANALIFAGVKTLQEAIAFSKVYMEFRNPNRSYGSSKQIHPRIVYAMATQPRFKRLSHWHKRQLLFIHQDAYLGYPCFLDKFPHLSTKKIGELIESHSLVFQLGLSLPSKERILDLSKYPTLMEKVEAAYKASTGYEVKTILDLVSHWNNWSLYKGQWGIIEELSEVPKGFLFQELGEKPLDDKVLQYLEPKMVCRNLFGSEAKSLLASFKEANLTQVRWANALQTSVNGNVDITNKILSVDCLPIQDIQTFKEASDFLNHIGWKPALRMLAKTTYRYRGEDHPVQEFLIRDTGYLFNQLTHLLGEAPQLGRVQCWLSIHEDLSRQFIDITPDEVLPTHSLVKGLDGVASIKKNWTIRVPKNTRELKYYGEYLNFCIGGYGPYVQKGGIILLIEDGKGMPVYGIQIDPKPNGRGDVIQFYGMRNSAPDSIDRDQIKDTLRQAKVIF